MIPIREEIIFVIMTKATAAPHPTRRFFANATVDFGFPSGTKSSDGEKSIQIPVNFSSNSSSVMTTVPLAGSFR